jgi:hypothetical protein
MRRLQSIKNEIDRVNLDIQARSRRRAARAPRPRPARRDQRVPGWRDARPCGRCCCSYPCTPCAGRAPMVAKRARSTRGASHARV